MKKTTAARLALVTAIASALQAVAAAPAMAQEVPSLPDGRTDLMVGGISSDGSVVVGTFDPGNASTRSGFMWTEAGGFRIVGDVSPAANIIANRFTAAGVSNDGTAIVGGATGDILGASFRPGFTAYRWTEAGGFEDLGGMGGLNISEAFGISGDGNVVVGSATDAGNQMRAFAWTHDGGMVALGALENEISAVARAASYDGAVVVGYSSVGEGWVAVPIAFRWTADAGMAALPLLNGGNQSLAMDVSDDGRVIAGSATNGALAGAYHAVRWVDGAVFDLGYLGSDPHAASHGLGISGNGLVIVGDAQLGTSQHGFRWTEAGGMQSVEDWLRASGASIAADTTWIARATSEDGSVVVGETVDGKLFIARGDATTTGGTDTGDTDTGGTDTGDTDTGDTDTGDTDTGDTDTGGTDTGGTDTGGTDTGGTDTGGTDTGGTDTGDSDTGDTDGNPGTGTGTQPPAGLITVEDMVESLVASGSANRMVVGGLGILLNGAGSRPLSRIAPEGRTIAWLGGDWGNDDHGAREGNLATGELGIGHDFGPVQINGVLGTSRLDQDTPLGGDLDVKTQYAKLEVIGKLADAGNGGLWGVLTAAAVRGDADSRRAYIDNGGLVDNSFGRADVSGEGLRARLQWRDAAAGISPYGEVSHSRACLDGYTETGGAFPTVFEQLCDTATEARVGADLAFPMGERVRLVGTIEGVHRFQDRAADVSGTVVGIGGFNLRGADLHQDWVRAGAGLEVDIAGSTLSVLVNTTSRGESASSWIAAGWRIAF